MVTVYSSEWFAVDSVIKLRFHECGNSVKYWNDSFLKEWDLLLGLIMLVLHILISTSCLCVYVTMLIRVVVEKNSAMKRTSVFIAAQ